MVDGAVLLSWSFLYLRPRLPNTPDLIEYHSRERPPRHDIFTSIIIERSGREKTHLTAHAVAAVCPAQSGSLREQHTVGVKLETKGDACDITNSSVIIALTDRAL